MAAMVVGTNGTVMLPDPARCPDHPTWHIAVRLRETRRRLDGAGYHYTKVWATGKCPECGWKPTISTG